MKDMPLVAMNALQVCDQLPKLTQIGESLAKSGMLGSITASTGTMVALTCAQEGISLVQFKAKYHVMEDGNLSIKSRYLHSEFKRLGGKMHFNEMSDTVCDITFTYDGEEIRNRVTLDQFKANGVALAKDGKLKKNWRTFPADMLFARCCASAIRKLCPEADGGLYVQEELDTRGEDAPDRAPEPIRLSPEDVSSRIAGMKDKDGAQDAEAPEAVQPAEVVQPNDPDTCPVPGRVFGKKWKDLDSKALMKILKAPAEKCPGLTAAHRDAIVAVLGEREAEAQA